jgi:hypothetical protein
MKISVLTILLVATTIFVLEARHARLMMFVDIDGQEKPETDEIPITNRCMQALYEQAGPILMSASLWNNIHSRVQKFSAEIKTATSAQKMIYYTLYQKINDYIQEIFAQMPAPEPKPIPIMRAEKNLQNNLKIKIKRDQDFINMLTDFLAMGKTTTSTLSTMSEGNFYITSTFFIPRDWNIYNVNNEWFLLVPHQYVAVMQATYFAENPSQLTVKEIFLDKNTKQAIDTDDMAIGLKTHTFKKLEQPILTDALSFEQRQRMRSQVYMEDLCSRIFVNYDDIPARDDIYSLLPHHTIYLIGHGRYSAMSPKFQNMLQESVQLQKDIGFVRDIDTTEEIKEKNTLKLSDEQQKKIKKLLHLEILICHKISVANGLIANLSIASYCQFLDFLNTKIPTTMLYYSTCFGGGQHLQIPFVSRGVEKAYNYTIISDISEDVAGIGRIPSFDILSSPRNVEIYFLNGIPHARLSLQSHISFNKFFSSLKYNLPLTDILAFITYKDPSNIPAIRLPGTFWFSTARLKNVAYITNVAISAAKTKKIIDISGKKTALLYAPLIPVSIIINIEEKPTTFDISAAQNQSEKQIPLFMSAASDQKVHWLLALKAPHCLLTAIINNFFVQGLPASNIFLIDTLTACNNFNEATSNMLGAKPGEKIVLSHVIFFNGIQSPALSIGPWQQGMIFKYQDRIYEVVYAASKEQLWKAEGKIRNLANPLDSDQKITDITSYSDDYDSWYQEWKTVAENNATRMIDVEKLEEFVRTHGKKVAEKEEKRQARKKAIKKSGYFKKMKDT